MQASKKLVAFHLNWISSASEKRACMAKAGMWLSNNVTSPPAACGAVRRPPPNFSVVVKGEGRRIVACRYVNESGRPQAQPRLNLNSRLNVTPWCQAPESCWTEPLVKSLVVATNRSVPHNQALLNVEGVRTCCFDDIAMERALTHWHELGALAAFRRLTHGVMRVDLFRLLAMHHMNAYYFDAKSGFQPSKGVECLDALAKGPYLTLNQAGVLTNWHMHGVGHTKSNSSMFRHIADGIIADVMRCAEVGRGKTFQARVWALTGPIACARHLDSFPGTPRLVNAERDCLIYDIRGSGRSWYDTGSYHKWPQSAHLYQKDACQGPAHMPVAQKSLRYEGTYYGGWKYNATGLTASSIVYSVGIGEDTTWDEGMHRTHGLHVWGFDPTPKAASHVARRTALRSEWFHFTQEGLATRQGSAVFTLPANPKHVSMRQGLYPNISNRTITAKVNTLENWMLRHGHTRLDLLKLDIEGAEYDILDDWVARKALPTSQLLVEFHHRFDPSLRTRHSRVLAMLRASGFEILFASRKESTIAFQRHVG